MGDGMPDSEKPRVFTRADKRRVSDEDMQEVGLPWHGRTDRSDSYMNSPRDGADRYDNNSSYRMRLGSKQSSVPTDAEETTARNNRKKQTRSNGKTLRGFGRRLDWRRSR